MRWERAGLPPGGSPAKRAGLAAVTGAALVFPILLAAGGDPLVELLADEDYERQRPRLLSEIGRLAGSPCEVLSLYAAQRNERVREHAVRALVDAGCKDFNFYRPYLDDPSPWVIESVLGAARSHLMTEAVPFLLDHLADTRRILTGADSWTISESAHRALRMVTCQSFHFEPEGAARGRQDATARWRQWYEAHRGEPREEWVEAGIELGREYAGRDYAPAHRREGLELLALIGPPALPALRAAFQRAPTDLEAVVACLPDEPPRVNERVPCVLDIRNASRRRVAIAPASDGLELRVVRIDPSTPPAPQSRGRSRAAATPAEVIAPVDPGPPGTPRAADLLPILAGRIIDLGPGEVLKHEFTVGPVPSAGRYQVKARLRDLAGALFAAAPGGSAGAAKGGAQPPRSSLPPIEATTIVRFEQ